MKTTWKEMGYRERQSAIDHFLVCIILPAIMFGALAIAMCMLGGN